NDIDRGRWLRVPPEDLPTVGARLLTLGVDQVALVTVDEQADLDALSPWYGPAVYPDSTGLAEQPNATSPVPVISLEARR
ncbi:MAG: hypothetical protein ACR2QK_00150, partial [Acidimicrobiales bacterium]